MPQSEVWENNFYSIGHTLGINWLLTYVMLE